MRTLFRIALIAFLLTLLESSNSERHSEEQTESKRDDYASSESSSRNGSRDGSTTNALADIFRRKIQILKSHNEVELVVLVDGSYSVGQENFRSEMKFIQKVISDVQVSSDAFRLGIVIYSTKAVIHTDHLSVTDPFDLEKCSLLNFDIPNIIYPGMNTNTKEALEKAERILTRARRGALKVVFLVTDGFSNMGNPLPMAQILKSQDIDIYTFGILNGNKRELQSIATQPSEEYAYLFDSFDDFEGFARRALHEDLTPGTYTTMKNSSFCHHLCSNSEGKDCCSKDAVCSCGLISGHFACLCPPGHYGSGLINEGCTPCPEGTYSEGLYPGDILSCIYCPDIHHTTIKHPATSKAHCVCQEGTVAYGDKCKIASCPSLSPPANGYFVKSACSNAVNAACGVRCHMGYTLSRSSVRICQKNGTWSGVTPICRAKKCEPPKPVPSSEVTCSNEEESFRATATYDPNGNEVKQPVDSVSSEFAEMKNASEDGLKIPETHNHQHSVGTTCTYSCHTGHSLVGSKSRSCLPMLKWSGLRPTCKSIRCPSLPEIASGSVKPKNCTAKGMKHAFGEVCRFFCDPGFELKGPKSTNCSGKHGTWSERNSLIKCVDVEPPEIDCPKNLTTTTDEELHFATLSLKLPNTTDNSGKPPVIWSKPAFEDNYPLRFAIGLNEVQIYSVDEAGNYGFCSFIVEVKDEEMPRVLECQSPPVFYVNEYRKRPTDISWKEPVFDDNSGVPISVTRTPSTFDYPKGTTPITYIATDAAGNNASCTLNITILDNPCSERPEASNTLWNCSTDLNDLTVCAVSCPEGFGLTLFTDDEVFTVNCTFNGRKAYWTPDIFQGDIDLFPECSAIEAPEQGGSEIILEGSGESCDDLVEFSNHLFKDVNRDSENLTLTISCDDELWETANDNDTENGIDDDGDNHDDDDNDEEEEEIKKEDPEDNSKSEENTEKTVENNVEEKTQNHEFESQLVTENKEQQERSTEKENINGEKNTNNSTENEKENGEMKNENEQTTRKLIKDQSYGKDERKDGLNEEEDKNPTDEPTLENNSEKTDAPHAKITPINDEETEEICSTDPNDVAENRTTKTHESVPLKIGENKDSDHVERNSLENPPGMTSEAEHSTRVPTDREKPTEELTERKELPDGTEKKNPTDPASEAKYSTEVTTEIVNEAASHPKILGHLEHPTSGQTTAVNAENKSEHIRIKRASGRRRKKLRVGFVSRKGSESKSIRNKAPGINSNGTTEIVNKIKEKYGESKLVHIIKTKLICKNGSLLRNNFCVKCPRGTFHNVSRSTCDPCPRGYYQETEGHVECTRCPEGYSTYKSRRRHPKTCKKICPPGTYGKKKPDMDLALSPCTSCPPGTFQSNKGRTFCEVCPNNYTTLRRGATEPDFCIESVRINDLCYGTNCHNGGSCFVSDGFALCKCLPGFAGSFCERRFDPCGSSPCYNDGQCFSANGVEYECRCRSGFEGDRCQREVNDCASNPCSGNGECIDLLQGFECVCFPGFKGPNCNETIAYCEELQPCQNSGICIERNGTYICNCQEGFSGYHCDIVYDCSPGNCGTDDEPSITGIDFCNDFTCPQNSRCESHRHRQPTCTCFEGFRGENCTEEINANVILNFPKYGVTEYLVSDFPEDDLDEISVCVWIRTKDNFNYGTLYSYATQTEDNAFTLTDYTGVVLYVSGRYVVTDLKANDGFWHFICVTWESRDGHWQVYLDGSPFSNGTGLSNGSAIPGGGKLVVGQEQDTFGGGFNDIESFAGRMTNFNVWKKVLNSTEVENLYRDCEDFDGNLIGWKHLLQNVYGDIMEEESMFCKACADLPHDIYGGTITHSFIGRGKIANYSCYEGFIIKFDSHDSENEDKYISNFYIRKCMKYGGWHVKEPQCKKISCGFPGYFLKGRVVGNSYKYGDELKYHCSEGYVLEGNDTRVCLANGTWSGETPYCRGSSTECVKLMAPRHGSMFVYFKRDKSYATIKLLEVGDRVEFICDKGFMINGFGVVTCMDGGVWDREPPSCEKIRCHLPREIIELLPIGAYTNKTFYFNDRITIICPLGEQKIISCGMYGTWNFSANICKNLCSTMPEHVKNGYFIVEKKHVGPFKEGEIVEVRCHYGYNLQGDDFFKCDQNGTWIQFHRSVCNRATCGPPPRPPPHFQIAYKEGYNYGDKIFLKCSPGYQSLGEIFIQCQANGKYSRVQNYCNSISCGVPHLPKGYSIKTLRPTYLYKSQIFIACPMGMSFTDQSKGYIECQASGNWSFPPECF